VAVVAGHGYGEVRRWWSTLDDNCDARIGVCDRRQDLGSSIQAVLGAGDVILAAAGGVAAETDAGQVIETGYNGSGEGAVSKVATAGGTGEPDFWRLAGGGEENREGGSAGRGHIWRGRRAGSSRGRGTSAAGQGNGCSRQEQGAEPARVVIHAIPAVHDRATLAPANCYEPCNRRSLSIGHRHDVFEKVGVRGIHEPLPLEDGGGSVQNGAIARSGASWNCYRFNTKPCAAPGRDVAGWPEGDGWVNWSGLATQLAEFGRTVTTTAAKLLVWQTSETFGPPRAFERL
jgi:hypothetical protein